MGAEGVISNDTLPLLFFRNIIFYTHYESRVTTIAEELGDGNVPTIKGGTARYSVLYDSTNRADLDLGAMQDAQSLRAGGISDYVRYESQDGAEHDDVPALPVLSNRGRGGTKRHGFVSVNPDETELLISMAGKLHPENKRASAIAFREFKSDVDAIDLPHSETGRKLLDIKDDLSSEGGKRLIDAIKDLPAPQTAIYITFFQGHNGIRFFC